MESKDVSNRLREFLGDAVCDMLREGKFEVTMHRVVYGADQPTERIEPFSVSGTRPLSPGDASVLRDSLLDETTWRWDLITRHRPIPEVVFELGCGSRHAVFVLDRRGGKLGLLRNLDIHALDFDPESRGAQALARIVDEPSATT